MADREAVSTIAIAPPSSSVDQSAARGAVGRVTCDLRLGDWHEALADVAEVGAVICDLPYSARTHEGVQYEGAGNRAARMNDPGKLSRPLGYSAVTSDDIAAFAGHWHQRCKGWFVTITDHQSARIWEAELERAGRYVFAPIPWVAIGSRVRLAGDGPSSWTCWIIVARPRCEPWNKWGTLPGAYIMTQETNTGAPITGTKPLALMEALIRDYTRPGDLVCDPCAGTGTTLLAARNLGRNSIGSEMDPKTYAYAKARLDPIAPTVALGTDLPQSDLFGVSG